jgi:hypothetical protein
VNTTISVMAGQAGTDRWIMTGGIFLVAGCYLVTASGLTERLTSSIQTCWPFIIAFALRRASRSCSA